MKIGGQLTERDFVAALYLHLRPRRTFAVVGVLLIALSLMVMVGVGASAWHHGRSLWLPITMLGFLVYLGTYFLLWLPYQARRAFGQQKAASLPFQATVSEEGLRLENQLGTGLLPWAHVYKWREGRDLFLVYFSGALYYVIPKRFFGSPQQVADFRAALERHARRGP
jgi:hypothetical protein